MSKTRLQAPPRFVIEDCNGAALLDTAQPAVSGIDHATWDQVNDIVFIKLKGTGLGPFVSGTMSSEPGTLAGELSNWWREVAESEIDMVVAKATEYGGGGNAIDLIDIGRDQGRAQGREVSDEEATELGIYFYLRGKLSRWTAAIIEHRRVSDDTITDINVYSRMAQRNRLKGGWPGV